MRTGVTGQAGVKNIRHGLEKHPLYHTWEAMRQRCNDPNAANYKNYGGRGISVCKRWNDFRKFIEDMGERPQGMTLDRINNDGNYTPKNCKWSTISEQNKNQRRYKKDV